MATIIKAAGRTHEAHEVQPVAFSFGDVTANAEAYLEQVRRQATTILAQAQKEAVEIKQQAATDGMRTAVAAAEKSLRATLDPKLGSLFGALQQTVEQVQQARQAWLVQWEKNAVKLAAAIAARVIRRELAHAPEITLELVREALELAAGSQRVQVALNPREHELLGRDAAAMAKTLSTVAAAEVVSDATIAAGGCIVTTEYGVIDNTFATQLSRIEAELS